MNGVGRFFLNKKLEINLKYTIRVFSIVINVITDELLTLLPCANSGKAPIYLSAGICTRLLEYYPHGISNFAEVLYGFSKLFEYKSVSPISKASRPKSNVKETVETFIRQGDNRVSRTPAAAAGPATPETHSLFLPDAKLNSRVKPLELNPMIYPAKTKFHINQRTKADHKTNHKYALKIQSTASSPNEPSESATRR